MKEQTRKFLYALDELPFFSAVGKPLVDRSVARVHSWRDAVDLCVTEDKEAIWIGHSNKIRGDLTTEMMDRWNPLVQQIRPEVDETLERHVQKLKLRGKDAEHVHSTARWDLVGAAMELEFVDVTHTQFYRSLYEWYLKGYFPCGWEGQESDGKLIVF